MDNYEVFAPFYDAVLGGRKERVTEYIAPLLKEHAPQASSVLEMACGTGNIMGLLKDEYEIAGFDLSPGMVEVAKQKFPNVDISVADMTDFDLGRTYDVILCLFDSINHLASFDEWKKTFICAQKHLNADGILLFDMNTGTQFGMYRGKEPMGRECGDDYALLQCIAGANDNEVFWNFKIFAKEDDGKFTLHEEHIRERTHPMQDVQDALNEIFSSVSVFAEDEDNPSDKTERLYFVCTK